MEIQRRVVLFELSGEVCAFPLEAVREILLTAELSHPPGLPPILKGFLKLSGEILGVIHLARLFHLAEPPEGLYQHLVVLKGSTPPLALSVDYVRGVTMVEANAFSPVGKKKIWNDCVESLATVGRERIPLLIPEKLLLKEERGVIAELQAEEKRRLGDLKGSRL